MISILLMILKIIGILLLVVLGIILMLVLLVLFVPIRYQITVHRKVIETSPVVAKIKITWLFHILNAAFSYPEEAYVRVRVFCFTIFRSDKPIKESKQKKNNTKDSNVKEKAAEEIKEELKEKHKEIQGKTAVRDNRMKDCTEPEFKVDQEDQRQEKSILEKLTDFCEKLWSALKNIKYTIYKIYDKIKHIINNIKYYIKIIKSDTFHRTWTVCSGQVISLFKSIAPRKLKGELLIGTGDPASTGQVLSIYGMLYPLLGNHIDITPDFDRQIVEGELFIKGKITVFKALKTAWIIYFNKDLRRLIKLFKREAA